MKPPIVPEGQTVHGEVKVSPGNILSMEEYEEIRAAFDAELAGREQCRLHPDVPQYAGQPLIPCPQYPSESNHE